MLAGPGTPRDPKSHLFGTKWVAIPPYGTPGTAFCTEFRSGTRQIGPTPSISTFLGSFFDPKTTKNVKNRIFWEGFEKIFEHRSNGVGKTPPGVPRGPWGGPWGPMGPQGAHGALRGPGEGGVYCSRGGLLFTSKGYRGPRGPQGLIPRAKWVPRGSEAAPGPWEPKIQGYSLEITLPP